MLTADEASGSTRYQMLETIRTFARERLEETGDLSEMFRRHADHYTRFAEDADAGLAGADEVRWRKRVHLEFDNLRAAFIRSLLLGEDDDVRRALRIVAALAFEAVNDRGLGIGAWAEHLAPRVDLASPAVRTAVLAAAAFSAQGRNDDDRHARAHRRRRCATACRPTAPAAVWAYIAIAAKESMVGDFAASIRTIEEAEAALTAAGDSPRGLSFLYSAAANFHNLLGDRDAARADAERSLEAARRSKNPTATASAQFARAVALAARRSRSPRPGARREHRARTPGHQRWAARVRPRPPVGAARRRRRLRRCPPRRAARRSSTATSGATGRCCRARWSARSPSSTRWAATKRRRCSPAACSQAWPRACPARSPAGWWPTSESPVPWRSRAPRWAKTSTSTRWAAGAELSLDEIVAYVFNVLDVAALAVP